ncbi:MAG TPA: phosphatidylcholine/phosphatidylserine synthase [Terriglobales bacterium]|nr:phosphatidylcholine/phosphatidylserine synthase [Terriglobales bacterium]
MNSPLRRDSDFPEPRRRLRKGIYLLPSLFTAGNIAAGYYAILQAMQGTTTDAWHFDNAAKAIGIAILFDGFDGRIARMTNTTSDFGRELDSLADCITFGVAPAVLAWMWGFRNLPTTFNLNGLIDMSVSDFRVKLVQLGVIASFIFLTAGASRLARFNITKNPQPSNPGKPGKKYFVGMPIPGGAGVIAAVVHFTRGAPIIWWGVALTWGALIVAVSFLMVSTWRFPSFKDIDLRQRHPFRGMVLIGAIIAGIWFNSEYVLFLLALTYMLSGVLLRLSYAIRRRNVTPPAPSIPQPQE